MFKRLQIAEINNKPFHKFCLSMMKYVNAGSTFVSVVEYGKETFVNIRQLCGGNEDIEQQGIIINVSQRRNNGYL